MSSYSGSKDITNELHTLNTQRTIINRSVVSFLQSEPQMAALPLKAHSRRHRMGPKLQSTRLQFYHPSCQQVLTITMVSLFGVNARLQHKATPPLSLFCLSPRVKTNCITGEAKVNRERCGMKLLNFDCCFDSGFEIVNFRCPPFNFCSLRHTFPPRVDGARCKEQSKCDQMPPSSLPSTWVGGLPGYLCTDLHRL